MNLIFEAVYKGFALGMALCIGVGPSFFALIQTSLNNGVRSGIGLALGIFLSDLTCVVLAYLGISQFFMNPAHKTLIGVVGGIILVLFGIYIMVQKKPMTEFQEEEVSFKAPNLTLTILKGYLLNLLNPVVILLWITWLGVISSTKDFTRIHVMIFFGTTLLTVVSTDILKVFTANKIKRFINATLLLWINRIVGIVLLTIGAWKLVAMVVEFYSQK